MTSEFRVVGGRVVMMALGAAEKPHLMEIGEDGREKRGQRQNRGRRRGRGSEKAAVEQQPVIEKEATEAGTPASLSLVEAERVIGSRVERKIKGGASEERVETIMEDVAENGI